jgi:hypothetical protein
MAFSGEVAGPGIEIAFIDLSLRKPDGVRAEILDATWSGPENEASL